MKSEGIKIYRKPRLKNPFLILAWPGMGEVAFKSASYLIEKLHAEPAASIDPGKSFYLTGCSVQDGIVSLPDLPESNFYVWKNKSGQNDIVIFLGSAQPDLAGAEEYAGKIIQVARLLKIKTVVNLAAIPQPIEHTQVPAVWFSGTSAAVNAELKKYNLNRLNEGQISGMNGLFLGIAKRAGFEGFCLLGEIPLYTIQIENPRASYAVLEALCRILKLEIDLNPLLEQAQSMEAEINKLMDFLKSGPQSSPIGEDEIERIKKSLGQLTRLPSSVKEKIERLFSQVKTDIGKAAELKLELDKWNVYKEYEDRFLDLFKKNEQSN
ncbi:MAG: PAC2 family protein [Candidatus Omnitrophota bacterium]|mgnify:CR=1 FL=1|jgi:proteasome assembly chaperone (PAC2) family protein|nr:PAC2 family protein [Candidatus Omnitrophota bacterium]MDD3982551.1 PAC2 family protein [Candidatus Omnitrophota bacterium]